MAFQTNVFRDGEWVTETVNIQAALKASAETRPASNDQAKPPACGILSQTLVESPVVHWVLPVRLRSKDHNDIAFIGSHFVQISQLSQDGQLHHVLRKNDFGGARIRNAIVIGESVDHGPDDDGLGTTSPALMRRSIFRAPSAASAASTDAFYIRTLPPQRLVLMLETGQLLFLFIQERPGGGGSSTGIDFVVTKYDSPAALVYLGFHLVCDPSSRYIAAASPDGVLVVFELESLPNLNAQWLRDGNLRPVRSVRVRSIHAVIHKVEFLFPRPEDDFHIILVMILVRKEGDPATPVSRLVTYEWEVGDNLHMVLAPEKMGHRLPPEYRMPILLIPIRFKTAFFSISPYSIGVVKYALAGSLSFDLLSIANWPPTKLHYGACEPLWTAWARPFRTKKYFEKTDIIYLAREDGAVIHLEIDATEMIPSVTSGWSLQTNIDTAFTTAFDIFSDVLIIGGDSGPGGIWKLAARSEPEQVNSLPNWSPVVDIAATNENSTWVSKADENLAHYQARQKALPIHLRKTDDVFSASGRGLRGNITHWRWGFQAQIGLDIEIGEPVRRAWVFTRQSKQGRSLQGLLELPNSSLVIQFREDFGDIETLPPEKTPFDVTSRTLYALQVSDTIIQVTETSINVIRPTETSRCLLEEALDHAGIVAENAFCMNDVTALSTHSEDGSQVHIMLAQGIKYSRSSSWDARGEVTCLSMFQVSADHFVVAASMHDGTPWITIYSLTGDILGERAVTVEHDGDGPSNLVPLEAITSVVVFHRKPDEIDLVLGSRCGRLLTARIKGESGDHVEWNREELGVARVDCFPTHDSFNGGTPTILVCCDDNLILMSDLSHQECKFERQHFIWPVDLNDTSLPSPAIHSVFQIPHSLSGDAASTSLVILSGSRLLLAEFKRHVGHVPRTIPLKGTPTRLMFSRTLRCLVVALLDADRPTLAIIDPKTGMEVSVASDKDKSERPFISGLGTPGDRIYGLQEWHYTKDGRAFCFILVTTKSGRLVIVSTESTTHRQPIKKILYWTRYRKNLEKPIYSIAGDAEGLLYCVDRTLHWDVLDLAAKKLQGIKTIQIDSPATSLQIVKGRVFVLTTMHSLMVIDHPSQGSSQPSFTHVDRVCRRAVHMIDIGDPTHDQGGQGDQGRCPLTLVSDQGGGVVGIWIPWGQRNREVEPVFEAALPSSIRRFVRTRIRPPWQSGAVQERYGTLPTTVDGFEIIGVTMGGAMTRFRLLGLDLWRVLALIQTLAQGSALVTPFTRNPLKPEEVEEMDLEPQPNPKAMHIDGDLLSRCLQMRALDKLVGTGPGALLFRRYLDRLEDGRYTEAIRGADEAEQQGEYLGLGYKILTFLVGHVN